MQQDNLEKFILANRASFDREVPSLKVWSAIDKELDGKKARRFHIWRSLRIAASVAILLSVGAVIGNYLGQAPAGNPALTLEEIAPEFVEMASYFEGQVDDRVQQLASYDQQDNVLADLDQLDVYMNELKEELLNAPQGKEQEIVENLIRGYQTKIEILERVLERLQSTNQVPINTSHDEISL